MGWSEIQPADIEAHLNEGELSEYRQHVSAISDPLPVVIADVTSMVRGYVAGRFALEDIGVPDALRTAAVDLVIHRLAKRVRRGGDDDGDRSKAAAAAMQQLRDAADGKLVVESGTVTSVDPRAGGWGSQSKFDSPAG